MRILLGAFIGGVTGFGIGYFGKCASGACPMTSNPVVSAILGALIGILVTVKL